MKSTTQPKNNEDVRQSDGHAQGPNPIVLTDNEYEEIAQHRAVENMLKIQLYDVSAVARQYEEQIDSIRREITRLNEISAELESKLETAVQDTQNCAIPIMDRYGLANSQVTISESSPHVITVIGQQTSPA